MEKQLAQRIVTENPAYVSPDDKGGVATAKLVIDRMQDELDSLPDEMENERNQLRARIEQYDLKKPTSGTSLSM